MKNVGDDSETGNNPATIQAFSQQNKNQQQGDRSGSMLTPEHSPDLGALVGFAVQGHSRTFESEMSNNFIQFMLENSRNTRQTNDDMRQMRDEMKQLRDNLYSKNEEIVELKSTIRELHAVNGRLNEEIMKLLHHSERCDRENADLKNRMQSLEETVSQLQIKIK
jgi:septal ring factor EnvC (AmiA/AmiB activator)